MTQMTRNRKIALGIGGIGVALAIAASLIFFGSRKTETQLAPAPVVVEVPRPISDVACGETYEFIHIERFEVDGRHAVNFDFGGKDRNLQSQYIWERNVIGQSTEIRQARKVDRKLEYSTVTFLCLDDPQLEGHKASNIEVMRYRLNLRRPLNPQSAVRNGGQVRR